VDFEASNGAQVSEAQSDQKVFFQDGIDVLILGGMVMYPGHIIFSAEGHNRYIHMHMYIL
jgi:hypothetical protein